MYIIFILPQKARIVYYVCDRTFWWYSGLKIKTKFMIKNCFTVTYSSYRTFHQNTCFWLTGFIPPPSSTWNLFCHPLSLTLGPFLNWMTLSKNILTLNLGSISPTFYPHIFCLYPFTKKSQSRSVMREKLRNLLS